MGGDRGQAPCSFEAEVLNHAALAIEERPRELLLSAIVSVLDCFTLMAW